MFHLLQLQLLDRRLQREVVLNTLPDATGEVGFLRAARILARLDHPSIPRVRDMGKLDERAFYATDALPGIDLEPEVRHYELPVLELA